LARGSVVRAVGLMVILAGSSALIAPLLLHFLLPVTSGSQPLDVDAGKMVSTLLVAQFLPLCVGLALRHWRPALAGRLQKPANRLSLLLNVGLLTLIISAQFDLLTAIPLRAFAGMLALVIAGLAAGWLLGGPGRE